MADAFAFRFSTKYWENEAKLYYYGFRFYAPNVGRWLNRDLIGELGGKNINILSPNNLMDSYDFLGMIIRGSSCVLEQIAAQIRIYEYEVFSDWRHCKCVFATFQRVEKYVANRETIYWWYLKNDEDWIGLAKIIAGQCPGTSQILCLDDLKEWAAKTLTEGGPQFDALPDMATITKTVVNAELQTSTTVIANYNPNHASKDYSFRYVEAPAKEKCLALMKPLTLIETRDWTQEKEDMYKKWAKDYPAAEYTGGLE